MNERKWRKLAEKKLYPVYERYFSSLDTDKDLYSIGPLDEPEPSIKKPGNLLIDDPSPLAEDSSLPDWFDMGPVNSGDEGDFRPFRLLQSLFSDRISFLQRSLEELEKARNDRERLTGKALSDLDAEIEECERYLAVLKGILNNRERRRNLERRLFELKRERRREALMNWKDILSLKVQARRLQMEMDSIMKTADKREASG